MKLLRVTLTVFLLSFFTITWSQPRSDRKDAPISVDPFSKGKWNFSNMQNLGFTSFSTTTGSISSFEFTIDPSYFFRDHFAVGISARIGSNTSHNPLNKLNSWSIGPTLMYGRQLNDKVNIYGKMAAVFGHSNGTFDISTAQNSPQKNSTDNFDLKGTIGVPISIQPDGYAYFTPFVSYDHFNSHPGILKINDYTFRIGFKLESFMSCREMMSDAKSNYSLSKAAYQKGANFLEFNTMGSLSFNTHKQMQGTLQFGDQHNNTGGLVVGYNYYFMDNLAGGLNLKFSRTTFKNGGSADQHFTTWSLQPIFTAQAPLEGAGRNLFLQAGFGFGGTSNSGLKHNTTDLTVRAGYNLFFGKWIALAPKIGYERTTSNGVGPSSGIDITSSGIAAEVGVRTWLNFRKRK